MILQEGCVGPDRLWHRQRRWPLPNKALEAQSRLHANSCITSQVWLAFTKRLSCPLLFGKHVPPERSVLTAQSRPSCLEVRWAERRRDGPRGHLFRERNMKHLYKQACYRRPLWEPGVHGASQTRASQHPRVWCFVQLFVNPGCNSSSRLFT